MFFKATEINFCYVFELFIDILGVRIDFVNLYFQSENWITDEMNKKFNSSKIGQLDEFVLEFDNRLPMYRKKPFDFNKLICSSIDLNSFIILKSLRSTRDTEDHLQVNVTLNCSLCQPRALHFFTN